MRCLAQVALVALVALAAGSISACAVGAGGSIVGEWRPRRVVESTACIESTPGACARVVEIGSIQPARSFGGGVVTFAAPGYAQIRSGGTVEHAFALDGSYEYLRGRGRFALAGRVGATLVLASDKSRVVVPVTLLGHVGGGWGSVFAGIGYAPLARTTRDGTGTYSHDGIEALVGTRIVLKTSLGVHITVSPELRYQRVGGATITALMANLGLHF